jgi:hypothetical protein
VDHVIKEDQSVDDLNHLTYRANTDQKKSLSILYASDLEAVEPICFEVSPVPIEKFFVQNNMNDRLVVSDQVYDDYHIVIRLKRFDPRVEETFFDYDGELKQVKENVLYKKMKKDENDLYTFKDLEKEEAEIPEFINFISTLITVRILKRNVKLAC